MVTVLLVSAICNTQDNTLHLKLHKSLYKEIKQNSLQWLQITNSLYHTAAEHTLTSTYSCFSGMPGVTVGPPPCIFRALTDVTSTTALGIAPEFRHFMLKNFSIPSENISKQEWPKHYLRTHTRLCMCSPRNLSFLAYVHTSTPEFRTKYNTVKPA